MAIEKFLAMENGEPGYTKYGTVTHVPFPAGGVGVQVTQNTGDPTWRQNNHVTVPFGETSEVLIEFTSLSHWGISSIGSNGVPQASAESIPTGIRTQRRGTGDVIVSDSLIEAVAITAGPHRWGVRFVMSHSSGLVEVWCDGVRVVNRTMRTTSHFDGSLGINALRLATPSNLSSPSNFDSVVIADEWLGDCHVDYLVPDSDAGPNEWSPSDPLKAHWEHVDEIPPSSADYVEANAVGLRDLYTATNLPDSGEIKAVQAVVHPWKFGPGTEIPTSTILKTAAGEHVDLIAGISTIMQGLETPIKTTRPGGGAWTVSDINNLQIGVTTEEP